MYWAVVLYSDFQDYKTKLIYYDGIKYDKVSY